MSENLARLQGLAQQPAAIEWFRGLFRCVHLEITDTGERFTASSICRSETLTIRSGLDVANPLARDRSACSPVMELPLVSLMPNLRSSADRNRLTLARSRFQRRISISAW